MKTIAIATKYRKHCGDQFNTVLGLDLSMAEAVAAYKRDWWDRLVDQDKKSTKLAYVSIVPIPEEVPEDGEAFQWYDDEIVLPALWEETALDTQDVVKDGKLVVAE